MDIADLLNPPKDKEDKGKYINRLKDYVAPKVESTTKKKLLKSYFDELKARIEYTMDMTQGGSHQKRPEHSEAEDVVLHTYLIVAELMQIYAEEDEKEKTEKLVEALEEVKKKEPPKKGDPEPEPKVKPTAK